MLIKNLNDTEMMAVYAHAVQPSDNRKVVVHDYSEQYGAIVGAMRYIDGRWIGVASGEDLTDGLTTRAIWSEMLLQD